MTLGAARIGDRTKGVCHHPSHSSPLTIGGQIVEASGNVDANFLGVARMGDKVRSDCGHEGRISTASLATDANFLGIARLGDKVSGTYVAEIITCSGNVDV